MRVIKKRAIVMCILLAMVLIAFSYVGVLALPYGATVDEKNTTTAVPDVAGNHSAHFGNVTELTIYGFTTTQTWQGYYGNVSGVIQLADSDDHIMYNWSDMNPRGEIYATTNNSLDWYYIQCFNYTADGTFGDDNASAGGTSQLGMNYTQLNDIYGNSLLDPDAVNNTFVYGQSGDRYPGEVHPLFYTTNLEFDAGECMSTLVYDANGTGAYDEVLMYEPTTQSIVFNSILRQNDPIGFDNNTHDFEMLVLENGHGVNLDPTLYYFYLELD